ncbi:MAG TPA: hypothetical protein VJM13_13390 [Sphingopyxis sp.]|nr:hypothetical protein [Sphingopyxis sp.]
MPRLTASLIALGLVSGATAASATDINSAADIGARSYSESVRVYPQSRDNSPKAVLARLDRLCASKRRSDQQQCEQAWRAINAAYAELQAKRAASALKE